MKTIAEMLKPRESVFSDTAREDVLNLSDFIEHRIDAEKFFTENFKTQGMTVLFDTAFARFKGESDTGVIKLTQAIDCRKRVLIYGYVGIKGQCVMKFAEKKMS